MSNLNQLGLVWVMVLTFVPMFICASLLHAKGVMGLLAITGIIAIGAVVFVDLSDVRMSLGGIAALVGLALGGKVSDHRHRKHLNRLGAIEREKRDAQMRSVGR